MADMKKVYDDLIIINLYENKYEVVPKLDLVSIFSLAFYQKAELNHFSILQFSNYSKRER